SALVTKTTSGDVTVAVTTLDTWAADQGWPNVSLIKMDIEGWEPEAIDGMRGLVRRCPHVTLIVECNQEALERNGNDGNGLFELLFELKFQSIAVLDDRRGRYPIRDKADLYRLVQESNWYPINVVCDRES